MKLITFEAAFGDLCYKMNYSSISSDFTPQSAVDSIGKEVRITTLNGITHHGILYVVDPVTKAVILTNPERTELGVVLNHAIRSIELAIGGNAVESFLLNTQSQESRATDSTDEEKKRKLVKWLQENGIEVLEDRNLLKISDSVTIEAPYDIHHCYCTNTVILERLQNIIKRMPH